MMAQARAHTAGLSRSEKSSCMLSSDAARLSDGADDESDEEGDEGGDEGDMASSSDMSKMPGPLH